MQFNNGDLVYSVKGDKSIAAVVDFETDDGRVYVSPWGKSLTYPERLILNKDLLFKKENKQYHINKEDINCLMKATLDIDGDIDNPPEQETMNVGDCIDWRGYTYKLEEILPNGDQVYSRNNALYMFESEDIKKIYRTKESVIKEIYGLDIANVVIE